MKSLVVIVWLVAAAATAAPTPQVVLTEFSNVPYDENKGTYEYRYRLSDGTRHSVQGSIDNGVLKVIGEYAWVAPNYITYKVQYTASEAGYASDLKTERPPAGAPPEIVSCLLGCG